MGKIFLVFYLSEFLYLWYKIFYILLTSITKYIHTNLLYPQGKFTTFIIISDLIKQTFYKKLHFISFDLTVQYKINVTLHKTHLPYHFEQMRTGCIVV